MAGGPPADGPQLLSAPADRLLRSTSLTRRLRFTGSTDHRHGNDDAHAEDECPGDDGGGDVLVLDDLLVQVAGRAFVEYFITQDRDADADGGEDDHVAEGLQQCGGGDKHDE